MGTSHFYAYMPPAGQAKQGTGRSGTKKTGQSVYIGSKAGVLRVEIWHDETTKTDMYSVSLCAHGGKREAIAGKSRDVITGQLKDWAFFNQLVGDEKKLANVE